MPTLVETLTRYFYLWEGRGRGWQYTNVPVAIEPPFTPFHPPSAFGADVEDDGLHATTLHFLFRKIFPKQRPDPLGNLALPAPRALKETNIAVFNISLPRSFDLDGYEAQQILLMLSYCSHPVSFEVVGTYGRIDVQFACAEADAEHVQSQLKTYYPTCTILRSVDALSSLQNAEVIEFGLAQEFMRPLAFADAKLPSMYLGMKGIFDTLRPNECACVQILFQGTKHPWTSSILRSVTDGYGNSFFNDDPEMPKLAQKKTSSPLFGVVVRMAVSASANRADMLVQNVGHTLVGQSASTFNSLIPLTNDTYDPELHIADVIARRSRHYGMLLNTEELATFVHIPEDSGIANALSHVHVKTKALSNELKNHAHVLGMNSHQGTEQLATVSDVQRFTHTHVIGATGTGKSTFLLNSIVQDICAGNGLALIDPHGDLVESVLNYIPEYRLKDVIIVDPSDTEYSVGFNILKATSELEKEVLSSDLVSMFQKFSTSWGDQMTSVLANTLLAFLESSEGGTLLDVRRFLLEPTFRTSVLKTVSDPSIAYYWNHEFPVMKTNSIGSILTRLDSFLRHKAIRHMVSQNEGLNFADILNSQKILLIKLSHGLIGETNSHLLGSLFLSKIYQTALGRQSTNISERKGFFVYVDEFQHYVTPSLSHLLSGGRKYSLGLTLAHQSLEQITNANSELSSSLIANAGIRVCFRLGESDTQKLRKGFSSFDEDDFMNLGTGQAICRVGRADIDFNLSVPKDAAASDKVFVPVSSVVEASRIRYGVLRSTLDPNIEPPAEIQDIEPPMEILAPAPQRVVKIEPQVETKSEQTSEVKVIDDPDLIQTMVKRKEESRHKYLQMLIKRNAESRGYMATLEQQTKDGSGRVDVVLQKDKLIYAIEVGITTTKEWEVHNIEKCLADEFAHIIALSEDMKGADLMTRKLTEAGILPKHNAKVKVYDLTGFMGVLNASEVAKDGNEKMIRGYRVKVEYKKQ